MALLAERETPNAGASSRGEHQRALKILAKSLVRQLRTSGYEPRDIVALSTELLGLITTEFRSTEATK
jgi:hypothetical protein